MKKIKRFPEIFVEKDYLTIRSDIIKEVVKIRPDTYKITLDHPVFGKTIEVMEEDPVDNTLCLRSVFPSEMQSEEDMGVVKNYLNNQLLDGHETYLEYYNEELGYFLLSRNIGIYPASTYLGDDDE